MAYNHGREDRKWRIWKEAEEKLLRECGVDEATIEQIRMADRADFNSNRRFYRWTNDVGQATILAGEYADRICYSPATAWMAYDKGVWEENEPKAQHVVQELTSRQIEQAQKELDTATQQASRLGVTAMLVAMSKAKALSAFTREQSQVYQEMMAAQEWLKFIYKCRSGRTPAVSYVSESNAGGTSANASVNYSKLAPIDLI